MFKAINTGKASKSSFGLLLLALILGGVGAQASGVLNSPSGGYLVCVNSKTKVVTHPGTTNCPKGSDKLVLGAQGAAGVDGLAGAAGIAGKDSLNGKDGKTLWNGVKDPENTWGAPGDMFINSVTKTLFGPKDLTTGWPAGVSMVGPKGDQGPIGLTGATGPQGPGGSGPAGPQGPAGAAGANGATGPAGANGIAAPIATGANCIGTKCTYKIGDTGPGGGTIFFVDYNDIYPGFSYLEASPRACESASLPWQSAGVEVTAARGWASRAVGAGQANTTGIRSASTGDTITNNAAIFAASCTGGGKSDWFLGSLGEMKLMYDNLQGLGDFGGGYYWWYWSSNEENTYSAIELHLKNGSQQTVNEVLGLGGVRPIRSF